MTQTERTETWNVSSVSAGGTQFQPLIEGFHWLRRKDRGSASPSVSAPPPEDSTRHIFDISLVRLIQQDNFLPILTPSRWPFFSHAALTSSQASLKKKGKNEDSKPKQACYYAKETKMATCI